MTMNESKPASGHSCTPVGRLGEESLYSPEDQGRDICNHNHNDCNDDDDDDDDDDDMAMMILIILMVTPASPSGEGRQCTPRALVERKPEIILILLIFSFLYLYVSPAFPPALPPALGFHCKPETFEPIAISFSSDHLAHLLLHLLRHLPLHLAALLPRNIRANVFWHLDVNDSEILKGSTVTLLRTTISSKCLDNLYNNT